MYWYKLTLNYENIFVLNKIMLNVLGFNFFITHSLRIENSIQFFRQ